MRINAIKLKILTARGEFGFFFQFAPGLTIIRGNNSSGKSTLFLSLLYGMGMEELAGGRNESILPYALKDHFIYKGERIDIIASEVYVEISNKNQDIVTFRRSIRDNLKSPKLIEILSGPLLTEKLQSSNVISTYLHDSGGAQKAEGFHNFLERFLDYALPSVPTTSGSETKLYLQAIFAALAIEQKRGWTDYIANIPFFGIRDARTRVVEFLLSLEVFETNAERSRLNTDSVNIAQSWESTYKELERFISDHQVIIHGIPAKVSALFDPTQVRLEKLVESKSISLPTYIAGLGESYLKLSERADEFRDNPEKGAQSELDLTTIELQRLANLFETASATLALQKASVKEYQQLYSEAVEDLTRNKTTLKLRKLGATSHNIEVAKDLCPTCHQHIEDSLLSELAHGPQMDIETNISYLEKQARMLDRQIAGGRQTVEKTSKLLKDLSIRIDNTRAKLSGVRLDVTANATESRSIIRQQIQIEIEIEKLQSTEPEIENFKNKFIAIAERLKQNQASRLKIPKDYYSEEDKRKIRIFEQLFRANASAFEYESAQVQDIKINDDTLVPYLSNIELREIGSAKGKDKIEQAVPTTDIKADSSASDFVRLILSYLIALYQASSLQNGGNRHPGIILLDEPGQHSMAQSSQRALLQQLSAKGNLQAIVAASFDESPEVFKAVTQGIRFNLIELDEKSIKPLSALES